MEAAAAAYPWGRPIAAGDRQVAPVAVAKPALCPTAKCVWQDIDEWLNARLGNGTIQVRRTAGESHCLQIACTMVAKWLGKPARLAAVLNDAPNPEISIAEGIRLLEQLELPYVAVETTRKALAQCRHPFVVIDGPAGKPAHAVAVMVSGQDWYEWEATRRLQKRPASAIDEVTVTALIRKEDAHGGR
jgi:hypothetical protein